MLRVPSTGAALPSASKTFAVLPGAPIKPPQGATIFEAKPTFEEAAKRAATIAGKGLPAADTLYPYIPPKTWTSSQPLPRGQRRGYLDQDGAEWRLAKGIKIGEDHWDVQLPGGGHLNVTADGTIAHGSGKQKRED